MRINKKPTTVKKKMKNRMREVKFKILETFYVVNFNAVHHCMFNFLM